MSWLTPSIPSSSDIPGLYALQRWGMFGDTPSFHQARQLKARQGQGERHGFTSSHSWSFGLSRRYPSPFHIDFSVFLVKGRWELLVSVEASQKHRNKHAVLNKSSISPEVPGCLWGAGSLLTQISRPGALWCWHEALQGVPLHRTSGGWAALSKHKHEGSSVPT